MLENIAAHGHCALGWKFYCRYLEIPGRGRQSPRERPDDTARRLGYAPKSLGPVSLDAIGSKILAWHTRHVEVLNLYAQNLRNPFRDID